jgi:hypothetical protein
MRRLVQKGIDRLEAEVALALGATGGLPPIVPGFSGLPVINVKAPPFNATGDGVTDDTVAIQAAMTFALTTSLAGPVVPGGRAMGTFATVYFPRGVYKVSAPAGPNEACIEVPAGIKVWGDREGSYLYEPTGTHHIMRWAANQNECEGLVFLNGKAAIAFNGPSRIYGGNIGSLLVASKIIIKDCVFLNNAGPSIWLDTSLEPRGSQAVVSILDCQATTSCFFYAGFDGCVVENLYGVVAQDPIFTLNIPVFDDAGHILPFFVNFGVLNIERMTGVPQPFPVVSGPASAWIGGAGLVTSLKNRFGGENVLLIFRKRTSGISLYGQSLNSVTDPNTQIGGFVSDADSISSTDGINWLEIYDSFPNMINLNVPLQGFPSGDLPPQPSAVLMESFGVFIDSVTCPLASYANVDSRSCVINFQPHDLFDTLRFRTGTDPLNSDGLDVSAQVRRFLVDQNVGSLPSAMPTLGAAPNLWPAGKLQGSNADDLSSSNVVVGPTDNSTGYAITSTTATASPAVLQLGFNHVTDALPPGEYTLSFAIKANYNGVVTVNLENPAGFGSSLALTTFQFSDGQLWQRFEVTFYNDGTPHGIGFFFGIPFTFVVGNVSIAFFALHKGRAAKEWSFPGNPDVQNLITANYRGLASPATGTYRPGDIVWNDNPQPGTPVGWVCYLAGTPGSFAPFGVIQFDPSQIAGYAFDYDAGDVPAGPIVSWPSKVGGAPFTLTGTATAFSTGGPNNLAYVQSNGTTDVMNEDNQSSTVVAAEFFLVCEFTGAWGGGAETMLHGGSAASDPLLGRNAPTGLIWLEATTHTGVSAALQQFAIWHLKCDGANVTLDVNEVNVFTGAGADTGIQNGVTLFATKSGGVAVNQAPAKITRAIGYLNPLSTPNANKVIAYLQQLYALP